MGHAYAASSNRTNAASRERLHWAAQCFICLTTAACTEADLQGCLLVATQVVTVFCNACNDDRSCPAADRDWCEGALVPTAYWSMAEPAAPSSFSASGIACLSEGTTLGLELLAMRGDCRAEHAADIMDNASYQSCDELMAKAFAALCLRCRQTGLGLPVLEALCITDFTLGSENAGVKHTAGTAWSVRCLSTGQALAYIAVGAAANCYGFGLMELLRWDDVLVCQKLFVSAGQNICQRCAQVGLGDTFINDWCHDHPAASLKADDPITLLTWPPAVGAVRPNPAAALKWASNCFACLYSDDCGTAYQQGCLFERERVAAIFCHACSADQACPTADHDWCSGAGWRNGTAVGELRAYSQRPAQLTRSRQRLRERWSRWRPRAAVAASAANVWHTTCTAMAPLKQARAGLGLHDFNAYCQQLSRQQAAPLLAIVPEAGGYGYDEPWPNPFPHRTVTATTTSSQSGESHEPCEICLADPTCPYLRRLQCQAPRQDFGAVFAWLILALLNLGTAVLYL